MYLVITHDTLVLHADMLNWQWRRDESTLVMFYKIINQYVDIPSDHILHKVPSITRTSYKKFLHLPSRIDSFMYSFSKEQSDYGTTYVPDHLTESDDVDTFKSLLANLINI